MKRLKKHFLTILLCLFFLSGLSLMLYPTVSDWWNSTRHTKAIGRYNETVLLLTEEEKQAILDDAAKYNEKIAENGIIWNMNDAQMQEYRSELSVENTQVMCTIKIPRINVNLPVYHTVERSVLQTAIGHMPGTSLPVGGEGTHCVLSGHRGLPSATLFTHLDRLQAGDTFQLQTLGKTLTYEVDQIRTVEPTDLSQIRIVEGMDYVTLQTCTPYGINTHRLLVRGHRVSGDENDDWVHSEADQMTPVMVGAVMSIPFLVLLLIGGYVLLRRLR